MNEPDPDPLLNELAGGPAYDEFRHRLKQSALEEFRRARGRRRIRRMSAGAGAGLLVILSAVLALSWKVEPAAPIPQVARGSIPSAPPGTPAPVARSSPSPSGLKAITPDQLMAAFPPGSCFLAELDGQTVLVFHDAALRDEFLR